MSVLWKKIQQNKKLFRMSMLLVSALLTALTLTTQKLALIEWVSLIPMAYVLYDLVGDAAVRRRGLYGYGVWFFQIFNMVNFHFFIALYPLDFVDGMNPAAALAVVLAGCIGLSALQSVTGGLLFVVFGEIMRSRGAKRMPYLGCLLAGGLWAILEWSQTLGWVGVPWGRLAIGQIQILPLLQSASLFGCCFVSFLIVCVNFFAMYAIAYADKRRLCAITAAGIFGGNALLGGILYMTNNSRGEELFVRMAVVQGNISSQEKWGAGMGARIRQAYAEGTRQAAEEGAQIVVWPETALPYTVFEGDNNAIYLKSLAKETGVTIFAGVLTPSKEAGDYNSILIVLPDGSIHETVYSKRHLVPFGEYVPMRKLFETVYPPLTELSMLSEDCVPGEDAAVANLAQGRFGNLICFDSIYDELARDSTLSGAQALVIATNDSWFLDSAALYMHNAQAQLRAVENGRSLLRAGNTGYTTVISPRGEILDDLEPYSFGVMTADVELRSGCTLYTYIGNLFVYLCIFYTLLLLVMGKFYDKKCKSS